MGRINGGASLVTLAFSCSLHLTTLHPGPPELLQSMKSRFCCRSCQRPCSGLTCQCLQPGLAQLHHSGMGISRQWWTVVPFTAAAAPGTHSHHPQMCARPPYPPAACTRCCTEISFPIHTCCWCLATWPWLCRRMRSPGCHAGSGPLAWYTASSHTVSPCAASVLCH